jgi:hypothetical protein
MATLGYFENTNQKGVLKMKKDCDFRFSAHTDYYPPIIPRTEVQKYFPWLSAKRLANLDSLGEGPKQVIKNGRAVLYPTKTFLEWLDSRTFKAQEADEFSEPRENENGMKSKRGRKTKKQEVMERRG